MNFLKRIFGGGSSGGAKATGDPNGLYFYVRPRGCEEVVRVRIDRNNDLSASDTGDQLWVHKYVRGTTCFQQVELDLYFNNNRQLSNSEVQGGALVTEAEYQAWVDKAQGPTV